MQLKNENLDVNGDQEAFYNQFGKMALLVGTTDTFSGVQMDIGLSLIHAALVNNSYALYLDADGKPTAAVIWAYLNEENTDYYLKYGLLPDVAAWRSGPDLWILNLVAHGGSAKAVWRDLQENVYNKEEQVFMLRPSLNGTRRIVRISHAGSKVIKTLPGRSVD